MYNKYQEQNVDRLDVSCNTINILKNNNVRKLGELINYNQSDLNEFGITDNDIGKIKQELELLGLGIKR